MKQNPTLAAVKLIGAQYLAAMFSTHQPFNKLNALNELAAPSSPFQLARHFHINCTRLTFSPRALCVRVFVWLKRGRRRGSFVFLATINPCDTRCWGGIVRRRAVSHHASSICPGLERASACSHSLTHSLTQQSGHLKGRGVFVCVCEGGVARLGTKRQ
jgi:hypothetical protein